MSQIWENAELRFSEPTAIEINSINTIENNTLVKIADCHENKEEDVAPKKDNIITAAYKDMVRKRGNANRASEPIFDPDKDILDKKDPRYILNDYMIAHFMMPKDILILFQMFCGVSLAGATEETVRSFVDDVIPAITAYESFRRGVGKRISGRIFPVNLYTAKDGLEYPWPINNEQKVFRQMTIFEKNIKDLKRA